MKKIIEKFLGIKDATIKVIDNGSQNKTCIVNNKYILKIFNKDTIYNDEEMQIWEVKENIAEIANANGINAVLPYKINNRYIQKYRKYFSIYPFIKYKSLSKDEVALEHVQELARIVRRMHSISFNITLPNNMRAKFDVDLDKYILLFEKEKELQTLLLNNKMMLEKIQNNINKSLDCLKDKEVISHNDLKLDNVLWNGYDAYLIDWDATSYINHMCAANEYAYFWSVKNGELNKKYYKAFMRLYIIKHECKDNIYDVIYSTLYGKFSWFIYSLERSLYKDEIEAKKGKEAIIELIQEFNDYEKNIPEMISVFEQLGVKNENNNRIK